MKIDGLRHGDTFAIELCPAESSDFGCELVVGSPVLLVRSDTANDILMRTAEGQVVAVRGATSSQQSHLERVIAASKERLTWVASATPKGAVSKELLIQVHEFIGRQYVTQVVVGVDDRFVDLVRERVPEAETLETLTEWMADVFLINRGPSERQLMMVQGAPEKGSDNEPRAFRILGARWAVDVAPDTDGRLLASRLVSVRDAQTTSAKRPPMLLEGGIEFRDATFATRFKSESSLDGLVRDAGSYLAIWQQYQRLETEAITRRARMFGAVPYSSCYQLDNGNWSFSIAGQFFESGRALEDLPLDEFEIECVTGLPSLLKSGTEEDILETLDDVRPNERTPFTGSGLSTDGQDLVLRPADVDARMEETPPPSGYLVAGLRGDLVRLRRRRDAWERIRRQSCPMTHLGHLLEGQLIPVPPRKRLTPLSAEVGLKFGGTPTTSQISALDIALNTPDLAVVQGPPGTGKTRVLAALQSRLSELEGAERLSGSVLLSGYQHTAVENAAMSASTLGLPPIKIGRKRGRSDGPDLVDSWAREQAELVRGALAEIPDAPVRQSLRQLRRLAAAYQAQLPGSDEDRDVLREAIDLVGESVSPGLRDAMTDQLAQLGRSFAPAGGAEPDSNDEALRLVRGLRCDAGAFEDDGPRSAHRVLSSPLLRARLPDLSVAVLEKARDWMEPEPLDFLDSLSGVRDALLDELSAPETHLALRRLSPQVLRLLERAEQELVLRVESGQDGVADVLWDYLETLEGDSQAVRESLERYTLVLAATCQHAVHRHTLSAKGLTSTDKAMFETVIVDEAARATPLDLLIPMALAERRIVLVGDHRQLPHLLEPDIERELAVSVNDETKEALRNSLFQRLFDHLKRLQAQDGIARTITLDQQFRMHPVLGDFVSETFYGDDEQFTSPRPASEFQHELECVPACPAIWLDVPRQRGRERGGRSKSRPVEARAIAEWVQRVGSERPDLSVGVIAFYGEQVREIERASERCGLGQIEGGEFRIAPEWRAVADPDGRHSERLRIGTVDAFQGMEFDIVFLSVTRCNELPDESEAQQRRKYGFLMLPNRLCVAMSRQRRLLVVVGDPSMCTEPHAESAVPGLVRFRALCESDRGAVVHA